MFIADQLLFLELQKTGGSHIRKLLEQYTNGRTHGKHNRLLTVPENKSIIGTIRNPWDWYVSLWAYGVGGKGAILSRTGKGLDFDYYYKMLPKDMGKNWLTPGEALVSAYHDLIKPCSQWKKAYSDSTNPECFRAWLKLLLNPDRRFDIGEGYGFSPLSNHSGLLTYRYFRLFTLGQAIFKDQRLRHYDGIKGYDTEKNITSSIIKTESLEEDFIHALTQAGVELGSDELLAIRNKTDGKTNVSERKAATYYYDDETLDLVARKDRYLIDKYRYNAPV